MVSRYPGVPGHRGDNDTSIFAAESMVETAATRRTSILDVLAEVGPAGASCDEIARRLGWVKYEVRPRTSELRREGNIVDSGRRDENVTGRTAIVWVLRKYAPVMQEAA